MSVWPPSGATWSGVRAVVVGLGREGFAAADLLTEHGATVTVLDPVGTDVTRDRARLLEVLDAVVVPGGDDAVLPSADVVIATHGTPDASVYRQAGERGVPVMSDVALARLVEPARFTAWLGVAGPGAGATVAALLAILRGAGLEASGAGASQRPVCEAVLDSGAGGVLALELTGPQLHWTAQPRLTSAAVLGTTPVPSWYESAAHWGDPAQTPQAAYLADLGRIYELTELACIYVPAEPATEALVEAADVIEGARAIGLTTGIPAISMLGVVEDFLVDRAFIPQRRDSALEVARLADLGGRPVLPVLAAIGLARSLGVPPRPIRDAVRASAAQPPVEVDHDNGDR